MTPSGSGPRSTAVRRRVASGCLDHDHGRTRYVVGRLTRRQLRSWTVRLRAAHLLVAVRVGEWWDDALACLPAGAGSGGPTGPSTRRGWVPANTASGSPGSGSVAVRGGGRRAVGLEQAADQGGDGAVAQRAFVDPQPPATGVRTGPGDLGLQDGEHQAADS